MKKTELKIGTATYLILHIVSGTAGIAALFLPFAWGASPFVVVFNFYHLDHDLFSLFFLAVPFFLIVLISAAFVRWMISGLFSRPERAIAFVASSMMALGTLYMIISSFLEALSDLSSNIRFWLFVFIPLLTLLFGGYVAIKNLRNKGSQEASAVMTLQTAYLSNALLCLIVYFGDWQIGAYCVAITSGVYLTQIVLMSVKLGVFRTGTSTLAV